MTRVKEFLDYFPERIQLYQGLLTNNPIWIERTRNVGVITPKTPSRSAWAGRACARRASNLDLRKTNPYRRTNSSTSMSRSGSTATFMIGTGFASRS
jgi:NADH:ubiquinone oxidoreductase subunit D